ncbi:hypothetical protein CHS0354_034535 [Potamilus streckersoni]|uniref:Brix domain-containing protein n=1 Tax=Potamilus streckersoni TaxID=2493646 RepID=A0AAE0SGB5_9BIVA|nr:hypothetical protein CHS0354_034535 [Potamilus streckersoni]
MGRKGRKRQAQKVARKIQLAVQEEAFKKAPHSFVFNRGHVGNNVKQLITDMRHVMEPYTATHLKSRKKNVLKDFLIVAGPLNITHFIIFTKSEISTYMKICRLPNGPTLTFKVNNYCLAKDVISFLKKPNLEQKQFSHHPLLVMNGFSGESPNLKLMSTMFQNMYPSINVNKVKLNDIRRCVMLNYNSQTKLVDFRHYNIRVVPVGMSRSMKKLMATDKVPDMSRFNDISDFMMREAYSSESEVEEGAQSQVLLPQDMSRRGNIKSAKSAVRLTELGPRLTLQLVKVEDGVCSGQIMFHEFIQKTKEELGAMEAYRQQKKILKEQRKQQQQKNVERKKVQKEEHKQRSLEGMKKKGQLKVTAGEAEIENPGQDDSADEDDDVEYYRQEVGAEPDPDLQLKTRKRKKLYQKGTGGDFKRRKIL